MRNMNMMNGDNETVSNAIVDFVMKTATEKYEKGHITSTGILRKRRIVSIEMRYFESNQSSSFNPVGGPTIHADKNLLLVLRYVCKGKKIEVKEDEPHQTYVTFTVPVEVVESYISNHKSSLEDFKQSLIKDHYDVV